MPEKTLIQIQSSHELAKTDLGNATRLVTLHGRKLRWVQTWGQWLIWDGSRWKRDQGNEVLSLALDTVSRIKAEAAFQETQRDRNDLLNHAIASEAGNKVRAMIELAKGFPEVKARPEDFDRNPWLLNLQNGTLDLRRLSLHKPIREDMITRMGRVRYEPEADGEAWGRFLDTTFPDREELVWYLQKSIGYSLTGRTGEQVFFFLHGGGQNGKSTFIETVHEMLGEYAASVDASTIMARRQDGVRNDLARLRGVRMVSAIETSEGKAMDETLVKKMTGEDRITARFLYGEFFDYKPEFKLFLSSNHRPIIRGTDDAIWRRVRLIPFTRTIPEEERDRDLRGVLGDPWELAGVFNWALAGCAGWQAEGLGGSPEVEEATGRYRKESDVLGLFLEDHVVFRERMATKQSDLYRKYRAWCQGENLQPMSKISFGRELQVRSDGTVTHYRTSEARWWKGLGMVTASTVSLSVDNMIEAEEE